MNKSCHYNAKILTPLKFLKEVLCLNFALSSCLQSIGTNVVFFLRSSNRLNSQSLTVCCFYYEHNQRDI